MSLRCKRLLIGAVFGVLSSFAGFANAQVIFSEDFSGTGLVLDGTMEDESGAVWAANDFATDNGVFNVGDGTTATNFEGAATLAIDGGLLADRVYTISLDVESVAAEWVGIGFSENGSTGVPNRPQDRFAQSGGRAWFLYRPGDPLADQVQIFGGTNTANGIADDDTNFFGPLESRNLKVVLDTSSAGITADFLINDVSVSFGPQSVGGTVADFDNVGFTWEGQSAGGAAGAITVDNFSFSVNAIPEPGSLAFLGLMSIAGLARRRRS